MIPDLPSRLRDWRQASGLTQAQAAHGMGVDVSTWAHWEQGRKVPKGLYLVAVEKLLGGEQTNQVKGE